MKGTVIVLNENLVPDDGYDRIWVKIWLNLHVNHNPMVYHYNKNKQTSMLEIVSLKSEESEI